jgi:hypothetical protein
MPKAAAAFKANLGSAGGRQRNTDLVNCLVARDFQGNYAFDFENPIVEAGSQTFVRKPASL